MASSSSDIFQRLPVGLVYVTPGGKILAANPAVVKMLGFDSEESFKARNAVTYYVDPAEREKLVQEVLNKSTATGVTLHWQRRDGTPIVVSVSTHVCREFMGEPLVFETVIEDITARVELEERLRQSQRMEAVGRLAGGVAHDFNNLLTVIDGYAELALEQCDTLDRRRPIEEIRRAAESAAGFTRQLLAFSRRQRLDPVVVDVNDVVIQITSMLRRLVGEDVRIVANLGEGAAPVTIDRAQLAQVFVNLAVNARHAMPNGGSLTIEVNTTGDQVCITVADAGVGIEPKFLPHIFEPFFTTKGAGEGTGLGLATVFGIVTQSGGTIDVRSSVGKGTTFTILLPLTPGLIAPSPAVPVTSRARGSERVLVIEDEQAVGEVIRAMLQKDGYEVVLASTGRAALERVRVAHTRFHLVVSDMVLPDMSGTEVVGLLRRQQPGLKAVFMSGYPARPDGQRFQELGGPLVQKPFSRQQLSSAIRDALEQQGARHWVHIFDSPEMLGGTVGAFLAEGFAAGETLVAVCTPLHRATITRALQRRGVPVDDAMRFGTLLFPDAKSTLARFMRGGQRDAERFDHYVGAKLRRLAQRGPLRIFDEMVDVLVAEGQFEAAEALEGAWNDLAATCRFTLLCGYSRARFDQPGSEPVLTRICGAHDNRVAESLPEGFSALPPARE